jgi:hypothetical protein
MLIIGVLTQYYYSKRSIHRGVPESEFLIPSLPLLNPLTTNLCLLTILGFISKHNYWKITIDFVEKRRSFDLVLYLVYVRGLALQSMVFIVVP